MKLYADVQRAGDRLKVSLWAEDDSGRALRLTKLGRKGEDPATTARLETQLHRALRILCIEEKPVPALSEAMLV